MKESRLEYIQDTSLFFERLGVTRTAGMVLGYLMSDDRDQVGFEDIQNDLEISKGATSQTLKWLVQMGFAERRIKAGDRKTYFSFRVQPVELLMQERIATLEELINLFNRAKTIRSSPDDQPAKELENAAQTYRWIAEKLRGIVQEAQERDMNAR